MRFSRSTLLVAGFVFGLALNAHVYLQSIFFPYTAEAAPEDDSCSDGAVEEKKSNPNKMLFITCGGFVDS